MSGTYHSIKMSSYFEFIYAKTDGADWPTDIETADYLMCGPDVWIFNCHLGQGTVQAPSKHPFIAVSGWVIVYVNLLMGSVHCSTQKIRRLQWYANFSRQSYPQDSLDTYACISSVPEVYVNRSALAV